MAQHEVDLIGQAIAATEKEVFNAGFDRDDEDIVQDDTGDRSNEQMGEGLEGQHEPEDEDFESEDEQSEESDDASEGEQGDGEEKAEGEEQEAEGEEETEGEDEEAEPEAEAKLEAEAKPQGRVPSGRLREQTERAEKAERELAALRTEREQDRNSYRSEMDAVRRQVEALTQGRQPSAVPQPAQAEQPPDLFENPQGFVDWQNRRFDTALSQRDQMIANMRVENSLAIAHAMHKDAFTKAFEAVNKLNPQNLEDRAVVQRIYTAANPGEALVQWHKRNEVLRTVGDDPEKYEQAVASKVKNDPEFRRQLLEELRAEASGQRPSKPANTITRLPKSLNGATGQSSHGRDATDASLYDDSDAAVFNSAWR